MTKKSTILVPLSIDHEKECFQDAMGADAETFANETFSIMERAMSSSVDIDSDTVGLRKTELVEIALETYSTQHLGFLLALGIESAMDNMQGVILRSMQDMEKDSK